MSHQQIDPVRRQLSYYPMQVVIETQYGDMDVNGHINNVTQARYYESARGRAHLRIFDDERFFQKQEHQVMLVDSHVRFFNEVHFPAPVLSAIGLGRIGNSSYTFHQALFQDGQCVGISDATMVLVQGGKACPIPDDFRARMEALRVVASK